ncbi:hypothetical protein [Spartinivicinus ruber]|uniref:hypothetical protein n=1 Tax=Spartinivicinus ruber TaxID=2683272 RepID=UPI0013D6F1A5|nr:hypothetical protein [Spartinivicinus ruber]
MLFEPWFKGFDLWYLTWLLAFFINGPHFLISYLLFYRLAGRRVTKEPRFIFAGIITPIALVSTFVLAWFFNNATLMVLMLYTMFFLVGWHYVKQGFGILIVHSSIRKVYFSKKAQELIRLCLHLLWFASFLNIFNSINGFGQYWNLEYPIPTVSTTLIQTFQVLACLGLVFLIGYFFLRRYQGIKDSPSGLLGLFIQYVWLLPVFYHTEYALLIPMFHSLQYMLFASNVVTNLEKQKDQANAKKKIMINWWGSAFILAALGFYFIPDYLDSTLGAPSSFGDALFFLLSFILFINIHHYIIDSVLWKRESGLVRDYLKPLKQPA